MKVISIAELQANLKIMLADSQQEKIIITENGRAIAALVPLEESDLESLALSYNTKLNQILTEAEERIQKTGGIKHDDFWRSRF
ncbi:MAG: type II toxin-antitoxin system Phd/YefM family antitoxin [Spirulina sp.]